MPTLFSECETVLFVGPVVYIAASKMMSRDDLRVGIARKTLGGLPTSTAVTNFNET